MEANKMQARDNKLKRIEANEENFVLLKVKGKKFRRKKFES